MEFYTFSSQKRPVRLCEQTRRFAARSLAGEYGKEALRTPCVTLDHIAEYEALSSIEKYDAALWEIVKNAPIRICEGELLCGAATLGRAISHAMPAARGGEHFHAGTGTSHLTVDFFEVLEIGMDGIRDKVSAALSLHTEPRRVAFLKSCLHAIECMRVWHGRYLEALEGKKGVQRVVKNLYQVPFGPARNFYEAVQSVWFCFAFLRLGGVWPGIGRIDVLLGKYLKKDLAQGVLTLDEAREILAHFFIKGCEWITGDPCVSGDAQHYQNLVIGGSGEDGEDVTNEVTYLVLDIIEETGISDFPTTVRLNENTDEKLLRRVAQVMALGGGTLAVYGEETVLAALADMGYPEKEARRFANDGCWEVQIPGRTWFQYVPFDALAILQDATLQGYAAEFESFEELLAAYKKDLAAKVAHIFEKSLLPKMTADGMEFKHHFPCTAVSLFEHSCIERAAFYAEGGTDYSVLSPHIGGLPDVVNSLYAIKKMVFEEKRVSFAELMCILQNNWEGADELRAYALKQYDYYGNDNDEVDTIAAELLDFFSDACRAYDQKTPIRFVSGVSTFGRQIEWAPARAATAFGRKRGEVLSGNLSPTPGTDARGATAVIRSHCKANLMKQYTGAALDICFVPVSMDNENAVQAIMGLCRGFVKLGGYFMQIDTVDRETLLQAQRHPENYSTLSVRVSGWNARFVTLSREWQNMIIDRAK